MNHSKPNNVSKEVKKAINSSIPKAPKTNKFMFEDEFEVEEKTADSEFEKMMKSTSSEEQQTFTRGQLVEGNVVSITTEKILVDVGHKSEGQINTDEFKSEDGTLEIAVGDSIEAAVVVFNSATGNLILSKDRAESARAWQEISLACEQEQIIEGKVTGTTKGGLNVNIGVNAFLPSSQIDVRPVQDMEQYIGKSLRCRVIKFNRKRGNIVLSSRVVLEGEREQIKDSTLEQLKVGATVRGTVKTLTPYGAFVDLGGIDGLLHVTDLSWGRVKHPQDILTIGQEVNVRVLKFDKETEKVSLGLKQTQEDPWIEVPLKFPIGSRIKGKIVSLTDYGAFVEIEPGVEGLVHVSEMSWTEKVRDPKKLFTAEQEVESVVLDIDTESRRISLGIKQIQPNPWNELSNEFPIGSHVTGKIKKITDFGIFVGVKEGIDGLVHISELSWDQKISNPGDLYQEGQDVTAKVISIDKAAERFSLSIKGMSDDPWVILASKYKVGSLTNVKVTRMTSFGVFVQIEPGLEGMIHVSELSEERISHPEVITKIDETLEAVITNLDLNSKKISLSVTALKHAEERKNIESFNASQGSSSTSLGDSLNPELAEKLGLLNKK